MPPTSWVELALAGLAEARGHDGRGHRESLPSKLRRMLAHLFIQVPQKQILRLKKCIYAKNKKRLRRTHWPQTKQLISEIMNFTTKQDI